LIQRLFQQRAEIIQVNGHDFYGYLGVIVEFQDLFLVYGNQPDIQQQYAVIVTEILPGVELGGRQ
jgi:heat shock protein HspQ